MRCPPSHLSGLYNSLTEALGHRTYDASALEEDGLIATLELTVFRGFQKEGISKSLLEAIGRMQVVRGIQKPRLLACSVREPSRTECSAVQVFNQY